MNEMLKKSSKTLYIVCSCIMIFILIGYLGIRNVKDTYSATYSCSSGMRTWVSNEDLTDKSKGIICTKMSGSTSNPPSTLQEWCAANGMYGDETTCKNSTKRICDKVTASSFGGYCWKSTNCWLNCTYNTKAACETANPGYNCEKSEVNCCFQKTTVDTYCKDNGAYSSKSECETATKRTCTGAPNLASNKCYIPDTTSIYKGSCGDSEIDVGGYGFETYTCMINGKNYTYSSCKYNDGSQVDGNGYSWSTCRLSGIEGTCYKKNHKYIWSSVILDSSYTRVSGKTQIQCAGCEDGYKQYTVGGDCVSSTEDDTGGNNGGNTGGGGTTTPSNPSTTPSGSTQKPSSSVPSSSSNITENPKTGTVAILIVWIIALGTLAYSFVYFRQLNKNKK